MSGLERMPVSLSEEKPVFVINDHGERIAVSPSDLAEYETNPYGWGEAMVMTFDDSEGENDE
jgi:hypothetical protein